MRDYPMEPWMIDEINKQRREYDRGNEMPQPQLPIPGSEYPYDEPCKNDEGCGDDDRSVIIIDL
ncbi:hypothetical protein HQ545_08320 [Candidatus Woesearchaeota archaeon]|nr:hypothetical protein [Candidatus Woesearchaeota archaeon]